LIDPFHESVVRVALQVADRYGFVLGGGLALILHGTLQRPTEDIDLFGPETASVTAAAAAVQHALEEAGIRVRQVPTDTELGQVIDGMDYFMAEMVAFPGAGEEGAVRISLGHLDRTQRPVVLDVGPVMAMPDLIAWKVVALVSRAEVRDFVDVAVFLVDHDVASLLALARRVDPALEDEDVARAGSRLDETPDRVFGAYGLGPSEVGRLRARFAAWPRGDWKPNVR
jgi:hypothetical protein